MPAPTTGAGGVNFRYKGVYTYVRNGKVRKYENTTKIRITKTPAVSRQRTFIMCSYTFWEIFSKIVWVMEKIQQPSRTHLPTTATRTARRLCVTMTTHNAVRSIAWPAAAVAMHGIANTMLSSDPVINP